MTMQSEDELKSALETWSSQSWTRRDTTKLSIKGMENVGPMQLVLTSIFEERGVEYDSLAPAPRKTEKTKYPDPWAHAFVFEDGDQAPIGARQVQRMPEAKVHLGCDPCFDSGRQSCGRCGGSGRIRNSNDNSTRHCGTCNGTGKVTCSTCRGSGALYGVPSLWAGIRAVTPSRLLEADDLPNPVFFALNEAPGGGELIHQQKGPTIEELRDYQQKGAGAYREAAKEGPEVSIARNLCKHPELPEGVRLLRQVLELRRVAAWHVRSRQVKSFWVLGDPLQVIPKNALYSPLVLLPPLALVLLIAAGIAWVVAELP